MSLPLTVYTAPSGPCQFCQGTGYAVKQMTFMACLCPIGRAFVGKPYGWDRHPIHPEDFFDPREKMVG